MKADTLSAWLEAEGIIPVEGPGAIADVAYVRSLLVAAAKRGEAVSYSEILGLLGHRFTRPKMRALCKTLDVIDREAALRSEPELAVLVVRESDRLPGQGWWIGASEARGYKGDWTGPGAATFIAAVQDQTFAYWRRSQS